MHRAITLCPLLFLICVLQFGISGYAADPPQEANPAQAANPPQTANGTKKEARGIAVGAPKAFDNRTLNLMLERLSRQLAGINVIDQNALAKVLGTIQGSRVQETSRSFTIQGPSTPSLQSEHDTSSNLTPPAIIPTTTDSTKRTSSTPATTPAAPALPDVISTPTALTNLQYSMSASDLLNEQVDLTYEIINIQMLLDRSLSDRLLSPDLKPRLQSVIGVNVSIHPPRDAENAEAVIEITLRCKVECKAVGLEPSLIAAMPQEHTYNSVALNSKSNAFGGSAVIKLVNVGYSERHRGQTYYMFRDNDTISFQKQSAPGSGAITFGWAFRPVLGRKSVSPGTRQLFAVVSLPKNDEPQSDPKKTEHFSVDIKAYWRKYDQGSLTSANDEEIRPWSKVGHVLSLGTSLTYAPSGVTVVRGYDLEVPLTSSYLDALHPKIQSVTWRRVGSKQAVVTVTGQNLFSDTKVAMGDKILASAQDGLRLLPDQAFDITTDVSALVSDAAVLGRYGPATPLEKPGDSAAKAKLAIVQATRNPAELGGYVDLTIVPQFENNACLEPADLDDNKLGEPILFLNGVPVPGPYQFPPLSAGCLKIFASVPEAMFPKLSGAVMLKFPFRHGLSASQVVYDPNSVYKLQILRSGTDYLLEKANGSFVPPRDPKTPPDQIISTKNWRLLIANDPPLEMIPTCPTSPPTATNVFCPLTPNDNLARISIGRSYVCPDNEDSAKPEVVSPVAQGHPTPNRPQKGAAKEKSCPPKVFLLQQAYWDEDQKMPVFKGTYPLTVPKDDPGSQKPTLDANQSGAVTQHDAVWVSFTGTALSGVGAVTVSGMELDINAGKDGKSIAVLIPKWVTKDVATIDLTFVDKQGSQIGTARVNVKPNPSGATK